MIKEGLGAELWLIGRSYAASPERRSYRNINDGSRIDVDFSSSGDGLDTFFDKVSQEILSHSDIDKLFNSVIELSTCDFQYDYSKKDFDILQKAFDAVFAFQKILRASIKKVDKKDLGEKYDLVDVNYFTSFSSKFMHFHLPNCVFIIDSISNSHLQGKYSFVFSEGRSSIELDKMRVKKILKNYQIDFNKDNKSLVSTISRMQGYINHCCREYLLGCAIKEEYPDIYVTPRLIDTFVMYVNQKGK